jgi:hypothetical protein
VFQQQEYSICGMFLDPEDPPMRALSLCRSKLQELQKRIDRFHSMTFYSAISFMTLVLVATLPYRPF